MPCKQILKAFSAVSLLTTLVFVLAASDSVPAASQRSETPAQAARLPATDVAAWKLSQSLPQTGSPGGNATNGLRDDGFGFVASASEKNLFRSARARATGGQLASAIAVADLDDDGRVDIVAVNAFGENNGDGSVSVLLGRGGTPAVYDSGGDSPTAIVIGDLNHDGKPDLVVFNAGCQITNSSCVGVLLGNGDGSFQVASVYGVVGTTYASGGTTTFPIVIGDLNHDGKPDLVVLNQTDKGYGDGVLAVLIGNGDGTFKPAATYDSGGFYASSIALADLNGDGILDVALVDCAPSGSTGCPESGEMLAGVLLGNGDGTFQPVQTYSAGGAGSISPTPIVVADVNGDGKPDLLVGNYCTQENGGCVSHGSVGVLLGNGDGTFQPAVTYDSGGNEAGPFVVEDLNGDGKLDLVVVANHGAGVLLGNGDGTFQPAHIYPSTAVGSLAVADLNGDGSPDIVAFSPGPANAVSVLLNNGDGTFAQELKYHSGGVVPSGLAIADVNGDGRPDLVLSNWCATRKTCRVGEEEAGTVGVLLNNQRPMLSETQISTSESPSQLGQPVTFTAAVTSGFGAIPDGEPITFYDGKTQLASQPLTKGVATYTTSALSAKTHNIKAAYAGDLRFKPSVGFVKQVVQR